MEEYMDIDERLLPLSQHHIHLGALSVRKGNVIILM